jgi:hypothetical protein
VRAEDKGGSDNEVEENQVWSQMKRDGEKMTRQQDQELAKLRERRRLV